MSVYKDDRATHEKRTHDTLVGGIDSFMSDWGGADEGKSFAFWACEPDDVAAVERWVGSRGEFKRVRTITNDGAERAVQMSARDHCHVYIVREGHAALEARTPEGQGPPVL